MKKINKKGILNEVWIVIIMFIVLITVAILMWGVGTIGPLLVGEGKALTGALQTSLATNSPNTSLANASTVPIETANNLMGLVEMIVYLCFIGGFFGFLVVCYYVRTYKWLSMVWIALMIGGVFISMIISNAYQQAYASSDHLADLYSQWGTNDFLLNYLPIVIAFIGLIGGIILFAISATSTDEETEAIR